MNGGDTERDASCLRRRSTRNHRWIATCEQHPRTPDDSSELAGNTHVSSKNAFYLVLGRDVIFRGASRKSETISVKQY